MPLLLFILLVLLIAQVGFWDAFAAVLGAVAMMALFVVLALAVLALAGYLLAMRLHRRR